jgi:hypothetical protein
MTGHLRFILAPYLSPAWLEALAAVALLLVVFAFLRRVRGAGFRAAAFSVLLLALLNPSLVEEQRTPLKDTALLVVDDSASMRLKGRSEQITKAYDTIAAKLKTYDDLDVETVHVKGTAETDLFHALDAKLATIPHDRFAGALLFTDGEVHDKPSSPTPYSAPVHALLAGAKDESDRRLIISEAPAYGIVGKSVPVTLRIEDHPKALGSSAAVTFRRDNGETGTFNMPIGKDVKFDVPVGHAGQNLFVFSTDALPSELTPINNSAAVTISGIRDRLRVLLISGEPHIGGRTWRNFLKSDPAVDLIHFTILRSPAKMDGIPNSELALIAFPVRELFETKLKSFDLVIFDRFRQQSLVQDTYLENIAQYVEHGGALLISTATDEGIPPLTFSPLARVLPAEPTGRLLTGSFVPDLTDAGLRHPVTDGLTSEMPRKNWGPWFRQSEGRAKRGEVLMSGINNAPLLVLDRVGEGRVAQFMSDQFWLWSRGFAGGGPQGELLRRTAHWLVGEPELDEAALRARAGITDRGWDLVVTKQSLHEKTASIALTAPNGEQSTLTLVEGKQPGILEATKDVIDTGLYHLKDVSPEATRTGADAQEILVMVGPVASPEFGDMFATEEKVAPVTSASGGGIFWLQDAADGPEIRRTRAGEVQQQGRSWLGLKQNDQYRVTGSRVWPLWPAWVAIIVLLGAAMLTWRHEGRN